MKVLIRKTVSGTEYWDTVAKRTLFVPKGEKPRFEVEVPKAIAVEEGIDLINPDEMDIKQLITFGKEHGIEVPGNMKKEDTIRNYIIEELNAAGASDQQ